MPQELRRRVGSTTGTPDCWLFPSTGCIVGDMATFSDDSLNSGVQEIKRGIDVTLENECFASCAILIYSAIDLMAYLGMPEKQLDVTGKDFQEWADRYIHFPCKEQLSGVDLWAARCGMMHNYGPRSRLVREGKARNIVYADHQIPEIRFNPSIATDVVIVSVRAMRDALFHAIDRYLVDLFYESEKARVAETRLDWVIKVIELRKDET